MSIFRWVNGVLAPNGNIYGIPYDSTQILEIIPTQSSDIEEESGGGIGEEPGGEESGGEDNEGNGEIIMYSMIDNINYYDIQERYIKPNDKFTSAKVNRTSYLLSYYGKGIAEGFYVNVIKDELRFIVTKGVVLIDNTVIKYNDNVDFNLYDDFEDIDLLTPGKYYLILKYDHTLDQPDYFAYFTIMRMGDYDELDPTVVRVHIFELEIINNKLTIINDYRIDKNDPDNIRVDVLSPDFLERYAIVKDFKLYDGNFLINKFVNGDYLVDIYTKNNKKGIMIDSDSIPIFSLKNRNNTDITSLQKDPNSIFSIYSNNQKVFEINHNETRLFKDLQVDSVNSAEYLLNGTNISDIFISITDAENGLNSILQQANDFTIQSVSNLEEYLNSNFYTKIEINNIVNELDFNLRQYTDNSISTALNDYYDQTEIDNLLQQQWNNTINQINVLLDNYYTKSEVDNLVETTFSQLESTIDQKILETKIWCNDQFFNVSGDRIVGDSIIQSYKKFFFGDINENELSTYIVRRNGSGSGNGFFDIIFDTNDNFDTSVSKFRILESSKTQETFSVEATTGNTYIDGSTDINKDLLVRGNVVINGNLSVYGSLTNIDTQNLVIEDNVIELNKNETGSGITLVESGFLINRGTLSDVKFVFDDSIDSFIAKDINNNYINIRVKDPVHEYDSVNLRFAERTYVNVTGDTMTGNLNINANLHVSGSTTIDSGLTVTGDVLFNDNLTVLKSQFIQDNLTVNKNLTALQNTVLGNSTTNTHNIKGNITHTGNTTVTGNLTRTGNENITGNSTITGNLNVGTNLSNNHNVKGNLDITGTLTVHKTTTLNEKLYVNTTLVDLNTDELKIKDNIILINDRETSSGVGERWSGLEVDRGTLNNSQWVFDENTDRWNHLINGVVSQIRVPDAPQDPNDAISERYLQEQVEISAPVTGHLGNVYYVKQENTRQTVPDYILKQGIFAFTTNDLQNAFSYADTDQYICYVPNDEVYEYNSGTNSWVLTDLTYHDVWGIGRFVYNNKSKQLMFKTNTDSIIIDTVKRYRKEFTLSPGQTETINIKSEMGSVNGLDLQISLKVKDTNTNSITYGFYIDYEQFFLGQNITFDQYEAFNYDTNILFKYDQTAVPKVYYAVNEDYFKVINNSEDTLQFSLALQF